MTSKHNIHGGGKAAAPIESSYLVYFNGVRVPAIEVTVVSGKGQPLNARIALPPHKLLLRLGAEDRIQVAVFYLDPWFSPELTPNYCLLFEGSVTGFEYQTQAGQHTMSFFVQSNLSILSDLFFDFLSGSAKKGTAKTDQLYPNQLKIKGRYPSKLFSKKYSGKGDIARPFGVIENVFRAVLGKHSDGTQTNKPSEEELSREISSYYAKMEAQRSLWVSSQVDSLQKQATAKGNPLTSEQINKKMSELSRQAYDKHVAIVLDSIPSEQKAEITAKNAGLKKLLAAANDENLNFDATPSLTPLRDKAQGVVSDFQKLKKKGLVEELPGSAYTILSPAVIQKRQTDLLRKSFETVLRKKLESRSSISRSITQTGFFARFMRLTRFVEHWVASPYIEGYPGSVYHPADQFQSMGTGGFPLLRGTNKAKLMKALAAQSGVKQGKSVMNLIQTLYSSMYYEAIEIMAPPIYKTRHFIPYGAADELDLGSALSPNQLSAALKNSNVNLTLASYVTKPDEPFCAPPACNVLFPSMIRQWSFNEDYSAQCTRVYFNRKSHGRKLNLANKAPGYGHQSSRVGFPAVVGRHAQRASVPGNSYNDLELLVFPEEYYRGPKPLVTDVPFMLQGVLKVDAATRMSNPLVRSSEQSFKVLDPENLALSREAHTAAKSSGNSSYGLLSDVAKQEYYRIRGASTSGTASTVFNPYVVPGFPVAVFDSELDGFHVLGQAVSVQHTLTPEHCSTTVQLSHVRTYEEMFRQLSAQGLRGVHYGPASPIADVRDILQNVQAASKYYARLFYQQEIGAATLAGREQAVEAFDIQVDIRKSLERLTAAKDDLKKATESGDETAKSTAKAAVDRETKNLQEFNSKAQKQYKENVQKLIEADANVTSVSQDPALREEGIWDPRRLLDARQRATVYDYGAYFGWASAPAGKISPICLSDADPARARARFDTTALTEITVGIPRQYEVKLLSEDPEVLTLLTDTKAAMIAVARPVCTLDRYIDFYKIVGRGTSDIDATGRGRGIRVNPRQVTEDSDVGAVYYDIIRQFVGGPGVEPGSKISESLNRNPYDPALFPPLPITYRPVEGPLALAADRSEAAGSSGGKSLFDPNSEVARAQIRLAERDQFFARIDEASADTPFVPPGQPQQGPVYLTTIGDVTGDPVVLRVLITRSIASFADLPDSRKDWQYILYKYLTEIENKVPRGGGF